MNSETRRVVLVDDHEEVRRATELMLMASGFDVIASVNNGAAGVDVTKSDVPDVVISDFQMPGVNGFDLIRALRDDVKTADVPVILFTAASEINIAELSSLSRVKLLQKPASVRELRNAVHEAIWPQEVELTASYLRPEVPDAIPA